MSNIRYPPWDDFARLRVCTVGACDEFTDSFEGDPDCARCGLSRSDHDEPVTSEPLTPQEQSARASCERRGHLRIVAATAYLPAGLEQWDT